MQGSMGGDRSPTIWIDCSDLPHFFRTNGSVTGIQRVTTEFVDAALRLKLPVKLCLANPNTRLFYQFPIAAFRDAIERSQKKSPFGPRRFDDGWRQSLSRRKKT